MVRATAAMKLSHAVYSYWDYGDEVFALALHGVKTRGKHCLFSSNRSRTAYGYLPTDEELRFKNPPVRGRERRFGQNSACCEVYDC